MIVFLKLQNAIERQFDEADEASAHKIAEKGRSTLWTALELQRCSV